jgi:hypothetical protein
MPETFAPSDLRISAPLIAVALAVMLLFSGTAALWAHYGTAVFYEIMVAGLAACL